MANTFRVLVPCPPTQVDDADYAQMLWNQSLGREGLQEDGSPEIRVLKSGTLHDSAGEPIFTFTEDGSIWILEISGPVRAA
jgi:hypothetical protein